MQFKQPQLNVKITICMVISTTQQWVKQTVRYLVEMTTLILGYFYPKTWVVWITGKITQKFGLFLPTGFYSVKLQFIIYNV